MTTINEIRKRLEERLIEHDGNLEPNDLLDIIEDAEKIGIDKEQISRLVPEVDRSINWEHIRAEKLKAAEEAELEQEKAETHRKLIAAAPGYLDSLISYSMADDIVEAHELRTIFQRAEELEQDKIALATKISTLLNTHRYRPFPNANLGAGGLHEVLMSTNWYTEKTFPKPEPPPTTPLETAVPVEIVNFSVDKPKIKKGKSAVITWHVTGIERISITNLGNTNKVQARQVVTPAVTTKYRLTAGNRTREIEIVVVPPAKSNWLLKVILWIAAIYIAIRVLVWFTNQIYHPPLAETVVDTPAISTSAGPIDAANANASSDITAEERDAVVATMNLYLEAQGKDDNSVAGINSICDFYSYPVAQYFSKKQATRQYVFDDVQRYRRKYRQDKWILNSSDTRINKLATGNYEVDISGDFSYYIRKPKSPNGYRQRFVHNRYLLDRDYKISSVYEVK